MKKDWESYLPPATLDVHEANLQEFFLTMHKRQDIWWRRWQGFDRATWTDDPILRDYKFCNVYRELDRSSQYLINNVYLKYTDITRIVFCILAHRIYNKPETFEEIGYPDIHKWDLQSWLQKLLVLEERGFKTLNQEAYKINTYQWGGEPRWYAYTVHILDAFAQNINKIVRLVTKHSAKEVVAELRKYCGAFLTHEYYQDFCDLNTYVINITKLNKNDWTNAGPGAKGGLRLIFPSLPEERAEKGLHWLLALAPDYLKKVSNTSFKYLSWNAFTSKYECCTVKGEPHLHMMEMWACEYLKYKKMEWGVGKQRQQFTPR